MRPRCLFFPWSAGGGAGYTGRCLALAARLGPRFDCAFARSAMVSMVRAAGFSLIGEAEPAPTVHAPAYLPFGDVERVYAVTARYYRRSVVSAHVDRDLAAIDEFMPHVVVTDMQPTAVIAARIRGIPVTSLADTDFLSRDPSPWMPWSPVAPSVLLPHPDALGELSAVAVSRGLPPISHVSDLLWGDRVLVPSAATVEPAPDPPPGREPLHHVGPLSWDPAGAVVPPEARPHTRRVYVTIGSGGMVGDRSLRELVTALDRTDTTVFVSTGIQARRWASEHPRVKFGGFTGISALIDWSQVVVNHGGYSTVIAGLRRGRPQLVLPFMSEQEANGRAMIAAHDAGLVARSTEVSDDGQVSYVNRHGGQTPDPVVPAADLAASLEELWDDPATTAGAGYAMESLAEAARAADFGELVGSLC